LLDFFKAAFVVPFSPHKHLFHSLKNLLGFYPDNVRHYLKAFRHKSAASTDMPDNERLEYLGDAVYGAVVAHFLFQKFPFKDEGFMSKMRSRMASRSYLNNLAITLGINKLVKTGRDRDRFRSVYGDAFEALIGAIYLDKGYDFTQKFIVNRIIKFHIDLDELEKNDNDYKSQLINWCQREKKQLQFKTEESGAGHQVIFKTIAVVDQVVVGRGEGNSKKRSEQEAAGKACEALKITSV
jgi:ribonuclease III